MNYHLVINTHWDREWRWSFLATRRRLCAALDLLIETMEKNPAFTSFLADSQAAMLDDYLDARPENRERVCRMVRDGRLCVGPWYTLPALFMISGEAIVRNLLLGHQIADRLGGVMKCAYNVFSWGQISQLPQIYKQFGMDTILFYRGIDQSGLDRLEYHWEAPDGSRMLGITFGESHRLNFWVNVYKPYRRGDHKAMYDRSGQRGYLLHHSGCDTATVNHSVVDQGNAASLDRALEGLNELLAELKPKVSTSHLLLLQGFDLENPDPIIPDLVEALNEKLEDGQIRISTISEYVERVRDDLEAQDQLSALQSFKGEMLAVERVGMGFGPLFAGVYSSRMNIKAANHRSQVGLEAWAEPAASWALMCGTAYPRSLLQDAWKRLCQNQQHDGIGGCHVDRVTLSVLERYRTVDDISEDVTQSALEFIVGEIDYSHLSENEIGLTVFNPLSVPYTGAFESYIHIPQEAAPAGQYGYRRPGSLTVYDHAGQPVEAQVLACEDQQVSALLKFGNVDKFNAIRFKVALDVQAVPPMGYQCYIVRCRPQEYRFVESLVSDVNTLENEFLRVVIQGDGSLDLHDKRTGQDYTGLHVFEDGGEEGGPLMHVPPAGDKVYTTSGLTADVARICEGPVQGSFLIERDWQLPDGVTSDLRIHIPNGPRFIEHSATRRSLHHTVLRIRSEVRLQVGVPFLEVRTTVDNRIRDHRLRVRFSTHVQTDIHQADSPFDLVSRPIAVPDSRDWYEAALYTWPTQSLVNLSDGKQRGLAVLHAGLSEYEVTQDPSHTIAMTLLRCFGTAGGGADTYSPQPLAQLQGEHEFRYALYPHDGSADAAELLQQAKRFYTPLRAVQCTAHGGGMLPAAPHSFVKIDSTDLIVSALKQCESGKTMLLRCYNPLQTPVEATIELGRAVSRVREMTLEEIDGDAISLNENGAIPIVVPAGRIMTLAFDVD